MTETLESDAVASSSEEGDDLSSALFPDDQEERSGKGRRARALRQARQ